MKLSFIYPIKGVAPDNKNWLWWVAQELKKKIDVVDNGCEPDCDVIVCMSMSQMERVIQYHIRYPSIPIIGYNWDWYPWADQNKDYKTLLMKSREIWSASEDAKQALWLSTKLKSVPVHGCIIKEEWSKPKKRGDYTIMASRDAWYKRFEWFENACEDLKIPYKSYHPDYGNRENYVDAMCNSNLLVSTSLYEGLGLTPIEGAYCGKKLVLSDIPVFRELWDGRAYFFKPHDYNDFKRVLERAYHDEDTKMKEENIKYVEENFLENHMAERIIKRFIANLWM